VEAELNRVSVIDKRLRGCRGEERKLGIARTKRGLEHHLPLYQINISWLPEARHSITGVRIQITVMTTCYSQARHPQAQSPSGNTFSWPIYFASPFQPSFLPRHIYTITKAAPSKGSASRRQCIIHARLGKTRCGTRAVSRNGRDTIEGPYQSSVCLKS
jgi:hypothetical protein